jgi:uncharacterized BrkB/YihY/UPF0761 family membrane protein
LNACLSRRESKQAKWYVVNVAVYNLIYGSVGAVIAFLLWSYLSAQILLLGVEFTAEYSRWHRRGYPVEPRSLREGMARSGRGSAGACAADPDIQTLKCRQRQSN